MTFLCLCYTYCIVIMHLMKTCRFHIIWSYWFDVNDAHSSFKRMQICVKRYEKIGTTHLHNSMLVKQAVRSKLLGARCCEGHSKDARHTTRHAHPTSAQYGNNRASRRGTSIDCPKWPGRSYSSGNGPGLCGFV